ncbi:MAG: hypothetical protein ACRD19_09115 [Terriglobia bacterium]
MVELQVGDGRSYYGNRPGAGDENSRSDLARDAACTGSADGLFPGCCCIWMGTRIAGFKTTAGTP